MLLDFKKKKEKSLYVNKFINEYDQGVFGWEFWFFGDFRYVCQIYFLL